MRRKVAKLVGSAFCMSFSMHMLKLLCHPLFLFFASLTKFWCGCRGPCLTPLSLVDHIPCILASFFHVNAKALGHSLGMSHLAPRTKFWCECGSSHFILPLLLPPHLASCMCFCMWTWSIVI